MEVNREDEISNVFMERPHVVLLGAGASKAALPDGDRQGRPVPLMQELVDELDLEEHFPADLRQLAHHDFEAAYSALHGREPGSVQELNDQIARYFSELELPSSPNLYDILTLSLREKDAIFTFNWDPFLIQSRIRLARSGITSKFPRLFFLHGNVKIGFCSRDRSSGLLGRRCSRCGNQFEASPLLFPVEQKDYQGDEFIEREWEAVVYFLEQCFMLTVFGYSAPSTDVEAAALLKEGWGSVEDRALEQTEIIDILSEDALRDRWSSFIHTHHYETHRSFFESWLGLHPRRSGEAYWNQYMEAQFIDDNPVPQEFDDFDSLARWFAPLVEAEAS